MSFRMAENEYQNTHYNCTIQVTKILCTEYIKIFEQTFSTSYKFVKFASDFFLTYWKYYYLNETKSVVSIVFEEKRSFDLKIKMWQANVRKC